MRHIARAVFLAVALAAVGLPAGAQTLGTIAGVVRDPSGAVLPGVTVEAASPALIEGSRTAVSGNAGSYRIENLRPGEYVVTVLADRVPRCPARRHHPADVVHRAGQRGAVA